MWVERRKEKAARALDGLRRFRRDSLAAAATTFFPASDDGAQLCWRHHFQHMDEAEQGGWKELREVDWVFFHMREFYPLALLTVTARGPKGPKRSKRVTLLVVTATVVGSRQQAFNCSGACWGQVTEAAWQRLPRDLLATVSYQPVSTKYTDWEGKHALVVCRILRRIADPRSRCLHILNVY